MSTDAAVLWAVVQPPAGNPLHRKSETFQRIVRRTAKPLVSVAVTTMPVATVPVAGAVPPRTWVVLLYVSQAGRPVTVTEVAVPVIKTSTSTLMVDAAVDTWLPMVSCRLDTNQWNVVTTTAPWASVAVTVIGLSLPVDGAVPLMTCDVAL